MTSQHARQHVPNQGIMLTPGAAGEPASSTLGVMARLRAATSSAHCNIEQNPRLAALLKPGLTEADYVDVLLGYHAYFARIEPVLFATLGTFIPRGDLDKRRKLPLLEIDLAELGAMERVSETPASWPVSMSTGHALGRLYVHEGASLGGRLIYAALNRNLGHQRPVSSRFFDGYGRQSAEVWRRTHAFIETGITGECDLSEAINAANMAFREIDKAMSV